jgi:predicted TIM-barrel fold metal-dependent hydrolase
MGKDADGIIMHGSVPLSREIISQLKRVKVVARTGVGDDYLLIATDYPHSDCIGKFPDRTVGDLTGNDHLSKETRRKILWDNPKRFYGLEV